MFKMPSQKSRSIFQLIFLIVLLAGNALAQKKPLDHSVYDSWESLGEKKISSNGQWIAYAVDLQEGDGRLIIQKTDSSFTVEVPRGYAPTFSSDDKYLIFSIKPSYKDTRQAKIKKMKPDDFPKDSLGIYELGRGSLEKIASVISYKLPLKNGEFFSYQLSKSASDSILKREMSKDTIVLKKDSVKKQIPLIIEQVPDKKQKRKLSANTENDADELEDAENGKILLVEISKSKYDKTQQPLVFIWRSIENRYDTLMKGGNDFKNFTIDHDAYQIAFLAERDSAYKSLQKFYKLWYWKNGDKEASVLVDNYKIGMNVNWTVNEFYRPNFSRSGNKLFLGTNPIKSIRDTSLIDIDLVKLDIWHYNDDYLQSYQLKNLDRENKRSYLASAFRCNGKEEQKKIYTLLIRILEIEN